MIRIIEKASGIVQTAMSGICILMFLIMAGSACLQVITRYVLHFSFSWTEELCRYSFIWLNMIGATICYKYGAHAVVNFHIKMLPRAAADKIFILGDCFVAVCGGLMATQGWKMALATANQPSPGMHLPMCFVYGCVVIAGLAIIVHAVCFVAQRVTSAGAERAEEVI